MADVESSRPVFFREDVAVMIFTGTGIITSLLIGLQLDGHVDTSWFSVFSPTFAGLGIVAYFYITMLIRFCIASSARITQQRKYAMGRRVFWPLVMVALLTASLGMLCSMLEGKEMDMGTVFAPLWTAIAIVGLATMRSNPRNTATVYTPDQNACCAVCNADPECFGADFYVNTADLPRVTRVPPKGVQLAACVKAK
eukprot:gene15806-6049_t